MTKKGQYKNKSRAQDKLIKELAPRSRNITEEQAKKRDDICNVIRLDPYSGSLSLTRYKCSYCGKDWLTKPSIVWYGIKGHNECAQLELANKKSKFSYGEIPNTYWLSLISNAKERKIKFDLEAKDIWNLFIKQNRKCYYSRTKYLFRWREKEFINNCFFR